jgi:hypothetical protein
MIALFFLVLTLSVSPFKSKSRLEAENAALRHQLIVLQRRVRGRVQLTNGDRLFLVLLYRWFPSLLRAITIIQPETLVRWHRAGFRHYWRWKSRSFGGRPQVDADLCALIRRMSIDNPLWGAPRIHGELLKLGFEVSQSSVAKYMVKRCGPPSQGWRTFLRNHAPDIAAIRRSDHWLRLALCPCHRSAGPIRRECVDHLVVLGEAHLRRILTKYATYYNELRTHRSLNKDAPIRRAIQHVGRIVSAPVLGGLHHHYCRI